MTHIFGRSIHKILSNIQQKNTKIDRCQSIFRRKKKENLSPYIILRATKEDFPCILNAMHNAYFRDEPTCLSLCITQNPLLDDGAMNSMAEGMSMVARCKYTGNIVGACINESSNPWDPDIKEKFACNTRCIKVRQLLLFYAYVQRMPNLWCKYDTHKIFEMSNLFVLKEHRKKGIARRLMEASRDSAADLGFKVVRCDASSVYTAKLCEKMHMEKIAEIPYCSYLGKDLEPVIQPPYPHVALSVYIDVHPQIEKKE